MSRLLSVLIAASLLLGQTAQASDSKCNSEALARQARLYRMQADDMKAISALFKENYDEATRDQHLSLGIALSSMTLLFAAEVMIGAGGAAVTSGGFISRAAYAHGQFIEGAANVIAAKVGETFLGAVAVVGSPAVTMPYINTVVASTLIEMKNPDVVAELPQNGELVRMNEAQLLQQISDLREKFQHTLEASPNQILDGLTLGSLDKAWTLRLYNNMTLTASLYEQLAIQKAFQLTQCQP
ncbi:hypothetical protein ACES2I_16345 [Bdellovibrio bacteriovorus]|uniref:hypothetical protein n=1 Tax=Bdellovibrio bacteriovorus TaxID=959 RepID=UPI0035A65033